MKKIQFIIISTILSFGLVVSSALLSNAIDKSNSYNDEITIKGVSEKRIKADKSFINIIYVSKNDKIENGQKIMSENKKRVMDIIEELKLDGNEYGFSNIVTKANFKGDSNIVLNYDFSQNVKIFLKNIDRTDEVYQKLLSLELEFNNLKVFNPIYVVTNIEKYKSEMLVDATKNSEMKAFEILKISGNKINNLKKITQGQFEILNDNNQIDVIDSEYVNNRYKKMRVVVTATYSIDKIK